MFCGAGNMLIKYGTRDLDKVKGLMRLAPASGAVLIAGALALGGVPPFACFVSEFMTVVAGVEAGYWWLMVIAVLLLDRRPVRVRPACIGGSLLGAAPAGMRPGDLGPLDPRSARPDPRARAAHGRVRSDAGPAGGRAGDGIGAARSRGGIGRGRRSVHGARMARRAVPSCSRGSSGFRAGRRQVRATKRRLT